MTRTKAVILSLVMVFSLAWMTAGMKLVNAEWVATIQEDERLEREAYARLRKAENALAEAMAQKAAAATQTRHVHVRTSRGYYLSATSYTCSRQETDGNPGRTSIGMRCGMPVMAVSQDMLREIPYGTRVRYAGRDYIVGDTMHARMKRTVDFPRASRRDALRDGQRMVRCYWKGTTLNCGRVR